MATLEDITIRTQDTQLKLLLSEIVSFWNSGAYKFQIVSTPPTDNPGDVQIRLYDSGAGAYRLYIYSTTSSAWRYVVLS